MELGLLFLQSRKKTNRAKVNNEIRKPRQVFRPYYWMRYPNL